VCCCYKPYPNFFCVCVCVFLSTVVLICFSFLYLLSWNPFQVNYLLFWRVKILYEITKVSEVECPFPPVSGVGLLSARVLAVLALVCALAATRKHDAVWLSYFEFADISPIFRLSNFSIRCR